MIILFRSGLQIPAFEIPEDRCVKVTVKEIVSPKDFWIQKTNDDLDLLMEKMWYVRSFEPSSISKLKLVQFRFPPVVRTDELSGVNKVSEVEVSSCSNTGSVRDDPPSISRKMSLQLVEISSI